MYKGRDNTVLCSLLLCALNCPVPQAHQIHRQYSSRDTSICTSDAPLASGCIVLVVTMHLSPSAARFSADVFGAVQRAGELWHSKF